MPTGLELNHTSFPGLCDTLGLEQTPGDSEVSHVAAAVNYTRDINTSFYCAEGFQCVDDGCHYRSPRSISAIRSSAPA